MARASLEKRLSDLERIINAKPPRFIVIMAPLEDCPLAESVEKAVDWAYEQGIATRGEYIMVVRRGGGYGFVGRKPKQQCVTSHHVMPGAERPKPDWSNDPLPHMSDDGPTAADIITTPELEPPGETETQRQQRWRDHERRIRRVRYQGQTSRLGSQAYDNRMPT